MPVQRDGLEFIATYEPNYPPGKFDFYTDKDGSFYRVDYRKDSKGVYRFPRPPILVESRYVPFEIRAAAGEMEK